MFGDVFGQVFGLAPFGKVQATDDRLARRARENKILEAQAKGAAVSGSLVAAIVPWGTIAAAGAELTALAFKVAILVRKHGDAILSGDSKAIAKWVRRAGKWNAKKRERVATRLQKELEREQKRAARKEGRKHGKVGDTLAIHMKAHKMKLAALVAIEAESRKNRHTPVIGDDPSTVPDLVEADPNAGLPDASEAAFSMPGGVPLSYWIAGAAGLGVLAVVLSRNSRSAA